MMESILKFLDRHIKTARAGKAKPVQIKNTGMKVDDGMISTQEYKLHLPYFKANSTPIFIKFGYKNHRVCVRVIDGAHNKKDYYGDNIEQLKSLIGNIVNQSATYQRTTWFLRAQLIPGVLSMIRSLLTTHHLLTKC